METASVSSPRVRLLLGAFCMALLVFGVILVVRSWDRPARISSIDLVHPFAGQTSWLRGQLSPAGTTNDNRPIVDIYFEPENGDTSEAVPVGALSFVVTPANFAAFSRSAPFASFLGGKRLYGYQYDTLTAEKEMAMQRLLAWQVNHQPGDPFVYETFFPGPYFASGPGQAWAQDMLQKHPPFRSDDKPEPYSYSQRFPGTFFAADADLNDPNSIASQFHGIHFDVTFRTLQTVTLTPSSLYLIIAEEDGVTFSITGITWCGDGKTQSPAEKCDDGNATINDGCTACQIDAGWACTGAPSSCTPPVHPCGTNTPEAGCEAGPSASQSCTAPYDDTCFYCDPTCKKIPVKGPYCGDGIQQKAGKDGKLKTADDEECDAGARNGVSRICSSTCKLIAVPF